MDKYHQLFEQLGGNLDALYEQTSHLTHSAPARLFQACYKEIHQLATREANVAVIRSEVIEGVERAAENTIADSEIELQDGLSILAMTATICPLIGLLGTVWGILEVFQAMDTTSTPSISEIAPGISAALITTIFGLFAAIPAAASYNLFVVHVGRMVASMENLAARITNVLVRHQIRQGRGRGEAGA